VFFYHDPVNVGRSEKHHAPEPLSDRQATVDDVLVDSHVGYAHADSGLFGGE
jgi:hypothetical protein